MSSNLRGAGLVWLIRISAECSARSTVHWHR